MSMCSYMEQMHVHDCQCMSSVGPNVTESIARLKDTEVMTLKVHHALHSNCESG